MDKIYSRKRIRLPKLNMFFVDNNGKSKKYIKIISVILIAIITFYTVIKSIEPIFENKCIEKAHQIATNITNIQSSNILSNIDYSDIVKITETKNGTVSVVKNDVVKMNKIASDIAIAIQNELSKLEDENITIPMGSLTGNAYFAGMGPNINIKVIPVGNIVTDFKSEFIESGINQTTHRIYLLLNCKVSILTPYKTISENITNQVLLVETLIVGEVPDSYYNLEEINKDSAIEFIN